MEELKQKLRDTKSSNVILKMNVDKLKKKMIKTKDEL